MTTGDEEAPQTDRDSRVSRYCVGDTIVDKYRLDRMLGEGGMGTVWLAYNLALETNVAVKLIRADLEAEDAAERLLKEARAAARLGHPAIVRVFDFGTTELGDPFIVMELLEGESLGDALEERSRVTAVRAAQTLLPVIDALACAHDKGIVHRDLKPENIFLAHQTKRTQPKIVDFGIAKLESKDAKSNLTRNGTVLGSPGYMSPEQARGLPDVDHRADIWSICVVLYEAVTGSSAFMGENYNALMRSIIEDPVVPTTELAAGDAEFWAILERGMKKDPAERWATMRDLGQALAEWLLEREVGVDICGEPIERNWFPPEPSDKPRRALSEPPPSFGRAPMRSSRDVNATLQDADSQNVPPSGAGRSVSPSSTSAVTAQPEPGRRSSRTVPFAIASVAVVLGAVVIFALRTGDDAAPAQPTPSTEPSLGNAPPEPVDDDTPKPAADTESKPNEATEADAGAVAESAKQPAAPAPEPAEAPPKPAALPPARPKPPITSPKRRPIAKPAPPERRPEADLDLKDPYQ